MQLRKRLLASLGLAALAAGTIGVAAPLGITPAGAAGPVTLTFLNFNDFHGRIDTNTVKWAGTIEQERAAAVTANGPGTVALLAAGDNVGASLFASAVADDQPTIDVLNAIGLQASSVGNHEFDQGFVDLRDRIINQTTPNAQWDYLAANVYDSPTVDHVATGLQEYSLITMNPGANQIVVGVIGAVTTETPSLVSPAGVAGLRFGDPVDAVNRVAAQLTDGNSANGEADVLIAEYHEGATTGTPPGTLESNLALNGEFAKIVNVTSPSVDAIFTGHTHQLYDFDAPIPGDPSHTRPILQTGSYGDHIGKVTMTFDDSTAGDPVISYTSANVARTTVADATLISTYPRVSTVNGIVTAALAAAATVGNQPIGSVTADITTAYTGGSTATGVYVGGTRDDRSKESTLSNLIADSLVATLSDPDRGGATIGVVNPGGVRAELFHDPDSIVTYAEANSILPFVNNLNTISLTGTQFKTLLEQQWQTLPDGSVPARPYLQLGLSQNVSYTYDPAAAMGSHITSIVIDGKAIDPAASYRIGSFSFLFDGGDNFRIFTQGTDRRDSGLIDRDAWISYLTDNAPVSPDFSRQSVAVDHLPTTLIPGQQMNFKVSSLDLTSLGAPVNTQLDVFVDGSVAGTVPVVGGEATVNLTVPGADSGAQFITLVAEPSLTVVRIPVAVMPTLAAITPTRLFDTRAGQSPDALRTVPKVKVGGSTVLEVQATDLGDLVPATGVGAVSLNVAVTNPSADGFVTVYDCGTRTLVASVNYVAGETVSNAVIAPVSATGMVCFYSLAPTDIVVDVNGWLATGSAYTAVSPERLFDTRPGQSPAALRTVAKAKIGGSTVLQVPVTDLASPATPTVAGSLVPATGVAAVSLNVAVTNPTEAGFVTVYDCGSRKLVASVNYLAGETASNAVIAPVSSTGSVCFYSLVSADVVVDINGWFATGSSFGASGPERLFDTRPGQSPNALKTIAKAQVGGGYVLQVKVTGLTDVTPATGVGAVSLNVAATGSTAPGFVTVFPCGEMPLAANLNFTAGQTVANAVIAPVSTAGTVCFYSLAPVDLVVDINGWFTGASNPVSLLLS